jgi:hypothetical protein
MPIQVCVVHTKREDLNVPRPRTQNSVPQLSAGQASYVLERLVSDRRVSPGEITRYVSEMHREISDLEQRLQSLRHAAGAVIARVTESVTGSSKGAGKRRGRRPGRPAGSGAASSAGASSGSSPAAASGVKRGPGRPPGSGAKRGPGRPKGSGRKAGAGASSGSSTSAGASNASAAQGNQGAGAAKGRKRRSAITPEQLASRQLQGRYLGLIRQVPASKRAQFQKIAKEKGREAAIREMQDAAKK